MALEVPGTIGESGAVSGPSSDQVSQFGCVAELIDATHAAERSTTVNAYPVASATTFTLGILD